MGLLLALSLGAMASGPAPEDKSKDSSTSVAGGTHAAQEESALRLEGEKRFRANCSRCHASPPTFPPRMMATIVRHMRVRANITDQDRKLILRYMTH
jgi:cytochrome c5